MARTSHLQLSKANFLRDKYGVPLGAVRLFGLGGSGAKLFVGLGFRQVALDNVIFSSSCFHTGSSMWSTSNSAAALPTKPHTVKVLAPVSAVASERYWPSNRYSSGPRRGWLSVWGSFSCCETRRYAGVGSSLRMASWLGHCRSAAILRLHQ
jgi:hypothetical protein